MNANLHHLELFYYVAKAKGISHAARIMPYGIQQPAISQQLMRLEVSLGAKLFERRPFSLTPAGESLYKYLSKFFDGLDSELSSLKGKSGIRMRFGCPSVISANYLPPLIKALVAKFPELRPRIFELDGISCVSGLISRDIDVAISLAAPAKSKALVIERLAELPMTLIVPKAHRFGSSGFWPKSDFASERWIAIQESSGGTNELRIGLSQFGVAPEFSASTNSIEAAMEYVEMGLGIALMAMPPQDLLKDRQVKAIPVPDIFGAVDLTISWLNDCLVDDEILKSLVKFAKERVKSILRK